MNKAYVWQVLEYMVGVLVLEELPVLDAHSEHPLILAMETVGRFLLLRDAYNSF